MVENSYDLLTLAMITFYNIWNLRRFKKQLENGDEIYIICIADVIVRYTRGWQRHVFIPIIDRTDNFHTELIANTYNIDLKVVLLRRTRNTTHRVAHLCLKIVMRLKITLFLSGVCWKFKALLSVPAMVFDRLRDEWVFKEQLRKLPRPNMAASSTTRFLGIVGPRNGKQVYPDFVLRFASPACLLCSSWYSVYVCTCNCSPFTERLTSIPRFKNVPFRVTTRNRRDLCDPFIPRWRFYQRSPADRDTNSNHDHPLIDFYLSIQLL